MFQDLREKLSESAKTGGYVNGRKVQEILDEEIKAVAEQGRNSPDLHQGKFQTLHNGCVLCLLFLQWIIFHYLTGISFVVLTAFKVNGVNTTKEMSAGLCGMNCVAQLT